MSKTKEQLFLENLIETCRNWPKEMVLEAVEDRLIVSPSETETQTKGGLWLPKDAQEPQTKGVVIRTGTRTLEGEPMDIKVGDVVVYSKYAGSDVNYEGIALKVLRHSDVSIIEARAIESVITGTED
jgi:chaperonin GroES